MFCIVFLCRVFVSWLNVVLFGFCVLVLRFSVVCVRVVFKCCVSVLCFCIVFNGVL